MKNKFMEICTFLIFSMFLISSCEFYKGTGEMDSYNSKSTMKPCASVNAPITFFEDVEEKLYFNGNPTEKYLIENRGAAIYVYDWENDSVFDWIFIPAKKGLKKLTECENGRFIIINELMSPKCTYIFDVQTGLLKKYNSDYFGYFSVDETNSYSVCNSTPNTSKFLFMQNHDLKIFDASDGSVKNVAALKNNTYEFFNVCYDSGGLAYFIYDTTETKISQSVLTDKYCIVVDLKNAKIEKEFSLPIYKKLGKTSKEWHISTDFRGLFENYIVTSNSYVDRSNDINSSGKNWLYFYDLTGTKDLQIPIATEETDKNGDTFYSKYIFVETPNQNYIIKDTYYPNSKTEFFTLNPDTESLDFDFEADINIFSNIKMSGNKLITWSNFHPASYSDDSDTVYCQTFDFSTKKVSKLQSFNLSDVR